MKNRHTKFNLMQHSNGTLWLKTTDLPVRVCTVEEAARWLKKTPRQIYRYLRSQKLLSIQKILGEWLIEFSSVQRLKAQPPLKHPIPHRFKSFFPEYSVKSLNAGEARSLVLERMLELGGLPEVQWAFRRYGKKEIEKFVKNEGERRLSIRARNFWAVFFGVQLEQKKFKNDIWEKR